MKFVCNLYVNDIDEIDIEIKIKDDPLQKIISDTQDKDCEWNKIVQNAKADVKEDIKQEEVESPDIMNKQEHRTYLRHLIKNN